MLNHEQKMGSHHMSPLKTKTLRHNEMERGRMFRMSLLYRIFPENSVATSKFKALSPLTHSPAPPLSF